MAGRTIPQRTCVGCRRRAPKSELIRVVEAEGACVPDVRGRLPGRGAYVHPDQECLDVAERRRAFSRALRAQGPLDCSELRAAVGALARSQRAEPATAVRSATQEEPRQEAGREAMSAR
ncbi:YlxR family protein [Motilibacter aurantiacus]|uniref:YlxR family protein n=1 Tax=Motilibacter aurantiacus TaxID=2714955 RepID=UPI001408EB43|nr:YlxR family protein [Motilibacter aurantiacus]